uniref:Peptidase M20 dimerisation domain-containing protein n=2 Tax=Arion vulgaris TaxID=1028688 RepID=A0A0B6ZWQ2_9EUPU
MSEPIIRFMHNHILVKEDSKLVEFTGTRYPDLCCVLMNVLNIYKCRLHASLSQLHSLYFRLSSHRLCCNQEYCQYWCLSSFHKLCNMTEVKSLASAAIDRESANLRKISLDIWEHPELCFEERHAHDVLTDFLESKGFLVERHYKLDTAFRATISSKELQQDAPNIGVMCEYDALPGIGHACGHNLIAILGLSVALGVKEALDTGNINGKLTVLGCPAEEGGGGKIDLINAGAYKDLSIAMMAHPSQFNLPTPVYVAMSPVKVKYQGKASHASSFPWDGLNALDAAVLCYQNVSCMRQQFKPTWRVHGVITNGGDKPNIIPASAELLYYARAPSSYELQDIQKRLRGCFDGAATATGCTVTYNFDPKTYDSLMSNRSLAALYVKNGDSLGIEFEHDQHKILKQGGSTDMGNVSRVLPSIHPKYSLNTSVSLHTTEFRDIARTESAHETTLLHAKALSMTAIDVFSDPSLVLKMKEEFKQQLKSETE